MAEFRDGFNPDQKDGFELTKYERGILPASDPFIKVIREKERDLFPEFKTEGFAIAPENKRYFYFAPNHHFRSRLLTKDDIKSFLANPDKRLLSVGAGQGQLERLLVHLGIPAERIALADREPADLPEQFKVYEFDMYKTWPNLGDLKYDLIIFPESLLCNVHVGDMLYSKKIYNSHYTEIEYRIKELVSMLSQAIMNLNDDGEIRINGHSQEEETLQKLKLILEKQYQVVVSFDAELITVKKNNKS